jgi:protein gp37
MGAGSKISWTDDTWNPWRGCAKVSPGCANCYAEELVTRIMHGEWGKGRPRVLAKSTLRDPFKWNKRPWVCDKCGEPRTEPRYADDEYKSAYCPACKHINRVHRRRIFSLSLGDWLDPEVPIEWLTEMLDTIRQCPNLDVLLLTKRIENFGPLMLSAADCASYSIDLAQWICRWYDGDAPQNIWIGVSVENQQCADERIPQLLKTPAAVRFLSVEPLLERVELFGMAGDIRIPLTHRKHETIYQPVFGTVPSKLDALRPDWVIIGGESGAHRRDCGVEAIEDVARQCEQYGVPCFVKQDCALRPGQQGRISDDIFSIKQFPASSSF